jgi:hypothetical protein
MSNLPALDEILLLQKLGIVSLVLGHWSFADQKFPLAGRTQSNHFLLFPTFPCNASRTCSGTKLLMSPPSRATSLIIRELINV